MSCTHLTLPVQMLMGLPLELWNTISRPSGRLCDYFQLVYPSDINWDWAYKHCQLSNGFLNTNLMVYADSELLSTLFFCYFGVEVVFVNFLYDVLASTDDDMRRFLCFSVQRRLDGNRSNRWRRLSIHLMQNTWVQITCCLVCFILIQSIFLYSHTQKQREPFSYLKAVDTIGYYYKK